MSTTHTDAPDDSVQVLSAADCRDAVIRFVEAIRDMLAHRIALRKEMSRDDLWNLIADNAGVPDCAVEVMEVYAAVREAVGGNRLRSLFPKMVERYDALLKLMMKALQPHEVVAQTAVALGLDYHDAGCLFWAAVNEASDDDFRRAENIAHWLEVKLDRAEALEALKAAGRVSTSQSLQSAIEAGDPREQAQTGERGADEPDDSGYVASPADPTAYVPASCIIAEHCDNLPIPMTPKELARIVENYGTNRVPWTRPLSKTTGMADPHRRSVHLAKWIEYVERFTGKPHTEDDWPDTTPNEVERRKAKVKAKKSFRK